MLRQRFGSSATRTLLVGDSLVDFETAANAPVPFCGVSWGFVPARLRAAAPPRMIDTAADLVAVVSGAVA
jgi:phosphoglycolate phosphatase-like HAD superfamily hydrolase